MAAPSDLAPHLAIADCWVTVCAARSAGLHVPGTDELLAVFRNAPGHEPDLFADEVAAWQAEYGRAVEALATQLFTPAIAPASWVSVPGRSDALRSCHVEFWACAAALLGASLAQTDRRRLQSIASAADVVFMLYNHVVAADTPLPFLDSVVEEVLHVPHVYVEVVSALGASARRSTRRAVRRHPVPSVPALADLWDHAAAQPWVWPIVDPGRLSGWQKPALPTRGSVCELLGGDDVAAAVARTPVTAFSLWDDDESAVLWLVTLGLLPAHPRAADLFTSLRSSSLDVAAVCATITATLDGLHMAYVPPVASFRHQRTVQP